MVPISCPARVFPDTLKFIVIVAGAWCVDAVRVALNGEWIFRKTISPTWVEKNRPYSFRGSEVKHAKDRPRWDAAMLKWAANPRRQIHASSYGLLAWFEGYVGSYINLGTSDKYDLKLIWGDIKDDLDLKGFSADLPIGCPTITVSGSSPRLTLAW
jgi:hypothetical protein